VVYPTQAPNIKRGTNVPLFFYSNKKGALVAATYFRADALSSALEYFTAVFGMGTGGTTPE
jgi:hypothetical protein